MACRHAENSEDVGRRDFVLAKKMRKGTLIKTGLTILLFIVLFLKLDLFEVIGILSSLRLSYFVIALFFVPILYIIRTYKWNFLLSSIKIKKPFGKLFKIVLMGVFYGLLTPGRVGEIGRVYHLEEKKSETMPTILMEKIVDIFILVLLSLLTVILFFDDCSAFWYILLSLIVLLILAILLLSNKKFLLLLSKPFNIEEESIDIYINKFSKLINDKGDSFDYLLLPNSLYFCVFPVAFHRC
jgi:uncharacterized protein (TIRG00374 family)